MDLSKILVIGDSWSSAIESDTNRNEGWPCFLGIDRAWRQAMPGATAKQWAENFDNRMVQAINTPSDTVILSLLGNDAMQAMADGSLSVCEVATAFNAMQAVIRAIRRPRTIVLLYTDPFCGTRKDSFLAVPFINDVVKAACPAGVEFFDTSKILNSDDFDGIDIHPTRSGHIKLAFALRGYFETPTIL